MNPIDLCIERPILTWMLMLSLIVFGVLGYNQLGVDQMPNMEFPIVTVTAQLEGAAPEVMEEDVTEVIEEHLNSIGGVRSLRSTTFHGVATVVAEFDLERDLDQATQDVRDRMARARYELPKELEPPVVDKINLANHPIMWIPLSSTRKPVEVTEYLKYTVKPYLESVDGVASMEIFGRRERAIRIWVDGEALRARGLSVADLIAAVDREHVERPGGRLESHQIEYSLKTDAEFDSVEALADLSELFFEPGESFDGFRQRLVEEVAYFIEGCAGGAECDDDGLMLIGNVVRGFDVVEVIGQAGEERPHERQHLVELAKALLVELPSEGVRLLVQLLEVVGV